MRLTNSIDETTSAGIVATLASSNNVSTETVQDVLKAALPELALQLEGNTFSRGRLADLVAALGKGHHESYLDNPDMLATPEARGDGAAILTHILGSEEAVLGAQRRIARTSGVNSEAVANLLPQIADLTMGGLARETKSQFADIFSRVPEIQSSHAGVIPEQRPLPVPSGNPDAPGGSWGGGGSRGRSPFDDLSDIIRRKGRAPSGGRSMGSVVKDILGQALGSRRGGVMTWIIRFILFRLAWPILKRIFVRVLFGR